MNSDTEQPWSRATSQYAHSNKLVIYAPGIHTGGGLTLLRTILASETLRSQPSTLFLDSRSLCHLTIPDRATLCEIKPSLRARLSAEQGLKKHVGASDMTICLHSSPPLFRLLGTTICFHQNILLLCRFRLGDYPLRTRLRLTAERLIGRLLRSHVDRYAVQTPTMKLALEGWHRGSPVVTVCPFMPVVATEADPDFAEPEFDFVYVSDGLAHKNHRNLLEAWRLLAEAGHHPSLCLTLTARDQSLRSEVEAISLHHGLRIENRSDLSQRQVEALYRASRALIFPSYQESFGLPLVEANRLGLPILAPERDYVRDVCRPAETFDPNSPISIARAVRRFLSLEETPPSPQTADRFLSVLLSPSVGEKPEDRD